MVTLPPRLYTAKVIRVHDLVSIEALIDLDFGVSVAKTIVLEGMDVRHIPPAQRFTATGSLISALGGKRILVFSAPVGDTDRVLGRVYLYDQVPGPAKIGLSCPPGLDTAHLEVSSFMEFARRHDYCKTTVVAAGVVLHGVRPPARLLQDHRGRGALGRTGEPLMSQPWNWEDSLRKHDVAVVNWLNGLLVNYDDIAGTTRNGVPILSTFAAPDRPFASLGNLLVSRGWIAGSTAEQMRANADESKWPVLPLPLVTIRRGDPQPDPELAGVPKVFRRRFFDIKTQQWVLHPWPGHYRTEYTLSFWSRSRMTDNYLREWLYSQLGKLGAGDTETFITVHHDLPWMPMDQAFKLVASQDTSEFEGTQPRYLRFDAIMSLRTWIMRQPVGSAYMIEAVGTGIEQIGPGANDTVSIDRWGNVDIQSGNLFSWIFENADVAAHWPKTGDATVAQGDPLRLTPDIKILDLTVTDDADRVELIERPVNLDGQGLSTIGVSFRYAADGPVNLDVCQRDPDTDVLSSAYLLELPATDGQWKHVHIFTAVNDVIANVSISGLPGGTIASAASLVDIDVRAINTQPLRSPDARLDGGSYWAYRWDGLTPDPVLLVGQINGSTGGPATFQALDDVSAPSVTKSQVIDSDINVAWVELIQPLGTTLEVRVPKTVALASITSQRYAAHYNGHDL